MDYANCIGFHLFAELHDCAEFKRISFKYILESFPKVGIICLAE